MPAPALPVSQWAQAVRDGDRAALARAITLIESRRPEDAQPAQALLTELLPYIGGAYRIGVSGAPGVGKSTFIEALGLKLLNQGKRVAVLAVDPSSTVSGGSILGDKTRMIRLSADERAFIRPSPSAQTLGGVSRRTREAMLLCEAAGYDVVLIETVGVGQSETIVAGMVDFFLVLMLPGGGDELQGIKKGILEIADGVAVNKADGDTTLAARTAQSEYAAALKYLPPRDPPWTPTALTCSARTGEGLDAVWAQIEVHRASLAQSGGLDKKRRAQHKQWMWDLVHERLNDALHAHPAVQARVSEIEKAVAEGTLSPAMAAEKLLKAFGVSS